MTFESSPTEIECRALFLADHAVVESGKLYVNGGYWNRLNFASFPVNISFTVAAVLEVPWRDNAEHRFSVHFETADGARVGGELAGNFSAGTEAGAKPGDSTILPIAAQWPGFAFEEPGDYQAVILVDDRPVNRWAFRVSLVAPPFSPPGPAGPVHR